MRGLGPNQKILKGLKNERTESSNKYKSRIRIHGIIFLVNGCNFLKLNRAFISKTHKQIQS